MPSLVSRIFMNGNSQAVRIPREFRLDSATVEISRTESGDLLIHPISAGRGSALLEALNGFAGVDAAFIAALEADHDEQPSMQDREAL